MDYVLIKCTQCDGSGEASYVYGVYLTCTKCWGYGQVKVDIERIADA